MKSQDVLDFWFLVPGSEGYGQPRMEWFRKDDGFDAALRWLAKQPRPGADRPARLGRRSQRWCDRAGVKRPHMRAAAQVEWPEHSTPPPRNPPRSMRPPVAHRLLLVDA